MSASGWRMEGVNIIIERELTRETVPQIWKELSLWKPDTTSIELSLKDSPRIDSAGMVLLIHLIQHAKISNCHIMLSFVPDQLKMLFQLSNIEKMMVDHIKN